MDKNQKNEPKTNIQNNNTKIRPIQPQTNKPKTSILKPRKAKRLITNKNKSNNLNINQVMIPQDTKETPKAQVKIENGDNNIQKKESKPVLRTFKRFSTISQKNVTVFNSQQKVKFADRLNILNKNSGININNTERNDTVQEKEKENGVDLKRSMTPKKKSKDIKLVPFDSIEKEMILEPKIIESIEKQISFCDLDELQSIYESFFIASIPKGEYSFAEDINNSGEAYCSNKLGQCGHESCLKLPAFKGDLIFQYPQKEKNIQNFQISELFISLC